MLLTIGAPVLARAGEAPAAAPPASPTPAAPVASPPAAAGSTGALPAAPADAGAVPDPALAQAREAFVLGTGLANQGQWPDALAAFERSAALRPHPVTTYNIGYSHRALGHYTLALRAFRSALTDHEASTQGQLPPDLLALARGYLTETEHRVAHALLQLPAGARLAVDGRPVEVIDADPSHPVALAGVLTSRGAEAVPSSLDVLVDPGEHHFVVSTDGAPDHTVTESFVPGATRELSLLPPQPSAPASGTAGGEVAVAPGRDLTWAWVAYGVGGAGLIAGSTFGLMAVAKKGYLDGRPGCPGDCLQVDQDEVDAMKRDATFATIGFAVAGAGAAVGTLLLLTAGPSSQESRADHATVRPVIWPGGIGAVGRF